MNPELPVPQINQESQPSQERAREIETSSETVGEVGHEREQDLQRADKQDNSAPKVAPLPLPAVVTIPVVPAPTASDDTAGPTIAGDDDLIEKEWVDKAKRIITETQNDPYRRELEVNKLQVDYLRKRYGKELGTSN